MIIFYKAFKLTDISRGEHECKSEVLVLDSAADSIQSSDTLLQVQLLTLVRGGHGTAWGRTPVMTGVRATSPAGSAVGTQL